MVHFYVNGVETTSVKSLTHSLSYVSKSVSQSASKPAAT
jgi:hypothetical protein